MLAGITADVSACGRRQQVRAAARGRAASPECVVDEDHPHVYAFGAVPLGGPDVAQDFALDLGRVPGDVLKRPRARLAVFPALPVRARRLDLERIERPGR